MEPNFGLFSNSNIFYCRLFHYICKDWLGFKKNKALEKRLNPVPLL